MRDPAATLAAFDRALAELRRLIAEVHTLLPAPRAPRRPSPPPPPDAA
jgi:hypothetical protein